MHHFGDYLRVGGFAQPAPAPLDPGGGTALPGVGGGREGPRRPPGAAARGPHLDLAGDLVSHLFPALVRWLKTDPLHVTAWLSLWVVMALINLVEGAARQFYALREKPFPVADLLGSIIRVLLIAAAIFSILRLELGVDISPLLASTALLTAVVGFALQGVLSNLLAGMSLHITRSVVPSDWISIGDVKGRVVATNWRETRVRNIHGHLTILPNSTVASSVIHNLRRQTPMRRHSFYVGASYADAPAEVIAALLAAARSVPQVLPEPAPEAFITEFKDFGINYVLRYWTEPCQELCIIDGDVARRTWYQFKRCGIEIPFPMSDKLLNDFMQVVYRQRSMPDEDEAILRRVEDLQRSDFCTRLLVDGDGRALLGDEDLQTVARSVRRLLYTRGETLFQQGETGDTCFVVVLGSVTGRVEYEDTAEVHEFEFGPGSLIGEMSLHDRHAPHRHGGRQGRSGTAGNSLPGLRLPACREPGNPGHPVAAGGGKGGEKHCRLRKAKGDAQRGSGRDIARGKYSQTLFAHPGQWAPGKGSRSTLKWQSSSRSQPQE